jgi:hypothetical protein
VLWCFILFYRNWEEVQTRTGRWSGDVQGSETVRDRGGDDVADAVMQLGKLDTELRHKYTLRCNFKVNTASRNFNYPRVELAHYANCWAANGCAIPRKYTTSMM